MNHDEKEIFENLFDSLDRLFDRECKTIDLSFLLYASQKALGDIPVIELKNYSKGLKKIVQSDGSEECQREAALELTGKLRKALSELLPM